MSEAFTKWSAADHLRTPEDIRLYLEACAEEDPGRRQPAARGAPRHHPGGEHEPAGARNPDEPHGVIQGVVGNRQSHFRNGHADHGLRAP